MVEQRCPKCHYRFKADDVADLLEWANKVDLAPIMKEWAVDQKREVENACAAALEAARQATEARERTEKAFAYFCKTFGITLDE